MPSKFPKLEALFGAKLDTVTVTNIHRLIEQRAAEDDDLDFKREPHESGEKFAADVCAMANSMGGVLVIGVDEVDGTATQSKCGERARSPSRLTAATSG